MSFLPIPLVFLNNFYRIDINKENELAKMMLQLCRIACSRHGCISFSPRSIDISLDGISKYIKKLPESLLNNFLAESSLNSKLPCIFFFVQDEK